MIKGYSMLKANWKR